MELFRCRDRKKVILSDLALIVLLGLIPISWFKSGFLIEGADLVFPLNPYYLFSDYSHVWSPHLQAGMDVSQYIPSLFPYLSLLCCLRSLGLSILVAEKVWFTLIFVLPALSMYYLMTVVETQFSRLARLSASIFYMVNPYTMILFHCGHLLLLMAYGIMPCMLALFIGGLCNQEKSTKYGLLIGLISLVFASAAVNLPMILVTMFPLVLYLIFFLLLRGRKAILPSFRFAILAVLVSGILNFWWILPLAHRIVNFSLQPYATLNWNLLWGICSHTSLINLFRLLGEHSFHQPWCGFYYHSYAPYYSSNLTLVGLTFLPGVLAITSLLLRSKEKYLYFFASLALLGIFFAKGTHPPLNEALKWLFLYFPGFWIFRNTYEKFMCIVVLGYAVLIGIALSNIYNSLQRCEYRIVDKKRFVRNILNSSVVSKVVIALLGISLIAVSWPLLTGDVIEKEQHGAFPSYHVRIPKSYEGVDEWLNGQSEDFRVFVLPQSGYVVYKWGYQGGPIIPFLIKQPQIFLAPGDEGPTETVKLIGFLYQGLETFKSSEMGRLLQLLNVKYILLDTSFDTDFYNLKSCEHFRSVLESQRGIHLEKVFGSLCLYKNEYFFEHIYATNQFQFVQSLEAMLKEMENDSLIPGNTILFLKNQLDKKLAKRLEQLRTNNFYEPGITFQKMTPVKYKVRINATEPFFLVFSESYHPEWKAYIGDTNWLEAFWREPVSADDHFLANGYANAWYIDPAKVDKSGDGEFAVTLYFRPQSLFYLGLGISLITLICCLGYLIWRPLRTRITKR